MAETAILVVDDDAPIRRMFDRTLARRSQPSASSSRPSRANSAAAVVGTLMWALLMQLLGVLPGTESIRPQLSIGYLVFPRRDVAGE